MTNFISHFIAVQSAFMATVIDVSDGDTFRARRDSDTVRIRVAHIDAPELAQRFGKRSKEFATKTLLGKHIVIRQWSYDKYDRIVGDVVLPDGRRFADRIVAAGLAWHYKDYSSDVKIATLETDARAARRGLWSDSVVVAPWLWRRIERKAYSPNAVSNRRFIDSLFQARPSLGTIIGRRRKTP